MIRLQKEMLGKPMDGIEPQDFKKAFGVAMQMKEYLRNKEAYAISADQVNVPYKMFVSRDYQQYGLPTDVFFNPLYQHIKNDEDVDGDVVKSFERCMSNPGDDFVIDRFTKILVSYYDPRTKKVVTCILEGLPALVFQHCTDHLNGILDIDAHNKSNPKEEVASKEEKPKAKRKPRVKKIEV